MFVVFPFCRVLLFFGVCSLACLCLCLCVRVCVLCICAFVRFSGKFAWRNFGGGGSHLFALSTHAVLKLHGLNFALQQVSELNVLVAYAFALRSTETHFIAFSAQTSDSSIVCVEGLGFE